MRIKMTGIRIIWKNIFGISEEPDASTLNMEEEEVKSYPDYPEQGGTVLL
jgi:hypothetical protein